MIKKPLVYYSYFSSSGTSIPTASGSPSGKPNNPTLAVLTVDAADTEQSYTLPAGTMWFSIINHTVPVLKVSYNAGESGSVYREIPRGRSTIHPELDSTASVTIYYQAATPGGRVEIESWS